MSTAFTEKGLDATFRQGMAMWPSFYTRICQISQSKHKSEKYAFGGRPAYFREWIGPRESNRVAEATFEVTNQKWEATMQIPQDDLKDDALQLLEQRVREMGSYVNQHKDDLLFKTVIDNATSTVCYDGQYFFDTDHTFPEGDYTTSQDNDLTGTAATGTAPTVLEFITSLRSCLEALRGFKDDKGNPVNPPGAKVLLEGPVAYEWLFNQLMHSDHFSHTAATASESNFIKNSFSGFMVNPWTANTDRYRAYIDGGVRKPYLFQDREPITTQFLRADDSKPNIDSFKHDENYFGARARYTMSYAEPLSAVLYTFT